MGWVAEGRKRRVEDAIRRRLLDPQMFYGDPVDLSQQENVIYPGRSTYETQALAQIIDDFWKGRN